MRRLGRIATWPRSQVWSTNTPVSTASCVPSRVTTIVGIVPSGPAGGVFWIVYA